MKDISGCWTLAPFGWLMRIQETIVSKDFCVEYVYRLSSIYKIYTVIGFSPWDFTWIRRWTKSYTLIRSFADQKLLNKWNLKAKTIQENCLTMSFTVTFQQSQSIIQLSATNQGQFSVLIDDLKISSSFTIHICSMIF